jgi:hypothetical protein
MSRLRPQPAIRPHGLKPKKRKIGVWIPREEYDKLMQLLTKIEAQLREILAYDAADPEVRSQLQPWRRQLLKMIEKVQGQK